MRVDCSFKPAWWLPGAHLQTLFPYVFRRQRPPPLKRERIELSDGDFVDIDWTGAQPGPLVLLLHGLEGSIRSHYVAGLLHTLADCGFQTALLYFRGCSGEPNRLPRSYHSGETGDLDTIVGHLKTRQPRRPLYIVGVSLGGNVLLKWLGEQGAQSRVERAVAVSVPFELNIAALRLEKGLSRLYQSHLLRKLRRSTRRKAERMQLPVDVSRLSRLKSFRDFDDQVTAPLHGFRDVDDYYNRCSSRQFLARIATPTLILHARDDPFMTPAAIPRAAELGSGICLEVCEAGGHVGFISGEWPWKPGYWLDERVCAFLKSGLQQPV